MSKQTTSTTSQMTNKEKRKKIQKQTRKRVLKDHSKDDIPNCPELDEIEYDPILPNDALESPSQLTNAEDDNVEPNEKIKQEVAKKLAKNQRELDIRNMYGYESASDNEDLQRYAALKELNEPFIRSKSVPQMFSFSEHSDVKTDPVEKAAAAELAAKRRKQTKEIFEKICWSTVSGMQHAMILLEKSFKYSSKYPTPFGLAILIFGVYMMVAYLELSAAAFAEWCIRWFWPITRIILRATEKGLKGIAHFLEEINDLGQSTYCDMADYWCAEYGLMCQNKCSFLDMAFMRSKL